jgi:hypothetical protein
MTEARSDPRPLRRRWLVAGLILAVVILLGAAAWVGVRAVLAKQQLEQLAPLAGQLKSEVASRDLAALASTSAEVGAHAEKAAALTGDPLWRAIEVLPVLGPNLTAARVASAQLDALSNDVITPLVAASKTLGGSAGGGIDVAAIQKAAPTLEHADATVQNSRRELDAAPTTGVIPQLASGVEQLRSAVDTVAPAVGSLAGFARLAPGILGADGPRTILMVVQNNAELRTGGGISGELVLLQADKGHLSFAEVADSSQFPILDTPIIPIPASTTKLYGDVVGRFVQDTPMPADFSLTGQLASAWWARVKSAKPDAVLSIDPGVLSAVLSVTGPVDIPGGGGQLTSDNVVHQLLVEPYLTLADDAQQNALFAAAAGAVFSRVTAGDVDLLKLVEALQTPVDEGRISLWSSHADEQRILASSSLAGPAERQKLAGRDAFSVYFNDTTAAKMDSFLSTTITSGAAACRSDGHRDMVVTVTLKNDAPADAGETLPGRMTGWGLAGTPPGDISTDVAVAAPPGSFYGGVTVDGSQVTTADATDAGHPTSVANVRISPGQSTTVTFLFYSAGTRAVHPTVLHTPMINAPEVSSVTPTCP